MTFASVMRDALHREPVVVFSCMLGGLGEWVITYANPVHDIQPQASHIAAFAGLLLPLVVPPIREAIYPPSKKAPPTVKQVHCYLQGSCTIVWHQLAASWSKHAAVALWQCMATTDSAARGTDDRGCQSWAEATIAGSSCGPFLLHADSAAQRIHVSPAPMQHAASRFHAAIAASPDATPLVGLPSEGVAQQIVGSSASCGV